MLFSPGISSILKSWNIFKLGLTQPTTICEKLWFWKVLRAVKDENEQVNIKTWVGNKNDLFLNQKVALFSTC